jgi:hypothetical protein
VTSINEEEPSQEVRIAKLRAELEKLGGTTLDRLESMPADIEEEFLRHVIEYETAEPVSLLTWLANAGIEVPAPDQLDDKALSIKLQEVIYGMAYVGAYLLHTNHLSDRELYEFLSDCLTEEVVLFPENPDYAYIIDMIGGVGTASGIEDNQTYLKYYADEKARVKWGHDWPGDKIPKHEDPPFDRDRFLPQAPLD